MKRSRIKPRSDRRRAEDDEWWQVREQVDRRDMSQCQARPRLEATPVPRRTTLCLGGNHPHHIWPVGRGGPRLDPDNVITVCEKHHRWIHENPVAAKPLRLLK